MKKVLFSMAAAFAMLTSNAFAEDVVGTDVYGLTSGATNVYYQMPFGQERALRFAVYSSSAGFAAYGFYKMYLKTVRDNMTPYLEAGAGYASGTIAAAANVGLEVPVSVVTIDPYAGFVVGGNGSAFGVGLNVAYKF